VVQRGVAYFKKVSLLQRRRSTQEVDSWL
jgi:hypothetical protein